jgi:hypothetical protein
LGHSFGAVIAQIAGGAKPIPLDDAIGASTVQSVAAVVAFSPPGPMPGRLEPSTWSSLQVPSLTLTGTADVLPGFIDDWQLHKASFENAPPGTARLWVGEGVDHYFGGLFGRLRGASAHDQKMLERALSQTLGFMEQELEKAQPCDPGPAIDGETYAHN